MRIRKIVMIDKNYLSYLESKDLVNSIIEKEITEFQNGKNYICNINNKSKEYKEFVVYVDKEKWNYLRDFCKNNGYVTITLMINLFIKENIKLLGN